MVQKEAQIHHTIYAELSQEQYAGMLVAMLEKNLRLERLQAKLSKIPLMGTLKKVLKRILFLR